MPCRRCFYANVLSLVMSQVASAVLITFTHEGTGSGRIGASEFPETHFTITATGDTASRVVNEPQTYSIQHTTASIDIAGVGIFAFISPTRTFVNNRADVQGVGFGRADATGLDLFDGPLPVPLWKMDVSVGPWTGPCVLTQWEEFPVETSGGTLFFPQAFGMGTFTAIIVPEPDTLLFFLGFALTSFCKIVVD
jgi:hypothetical protein